MKKEFNIDSNTLRELYKTMTLREIGNKYNIGVTVVTRVFKQYNIPRRHPSEQFKLEVNEDKLRELYGINKLPIKKIAQMFGVSSTTVRRRMRDYGIIGRTLSESLLISWQKSIGKRNKCNITDLELRKLYYGQNMDCRQIASLYHVSMPTILNRMKYLGIQRRSASESRKISYKVRKPTKSENSPNWKGGRHYDKTHGYITIVLPTTHPLYKEIGNHKLVEHRLVMMEHLGRILLNSEQVHHINGVKTDNRIDNLELISPENHSLKSMLCSKCELRKEIRLLRWELKQLREQLQYKFSNENK